MLPLSFADTLVEANEEVQAYRSRGGGTINVTTYAEIHLGDYVPGQDDSTPLAERYHVEADGTFDVMGGIRICPEGVWIQRFGMSFSLGMSFFFRMDSEAMNADDDPECQAWVNRGAPEFQAWVDLTLDAIVPLMKEHLVFN
jgi:hypothetical protein